MGRLHKRNLRGDDGVAMMSEQDDIDSDFNPQSEDSIISEEDDLDPVYYSSQSGKNGEKVFNRDSDSDSDSLEYYSQSDETPARDPSGLKNHSDNEGSNTSPTSDTEMATNKNDEESLEENLENEKKKKSKSFLGRLFGKKKIKRLREYTNKSKRGASDKSSNISDADIEHSDISHSEGTGGKCPVPFVDGTGKSVDVSVVSHSSTSTAMFLGDVTEEEFENASPSSSTVSPGKRITQEDRRRSYEKQLPGVVEAAEELEEAEMQEVEYKSYSVRLSDESYDRNTHHTNTYSTNESYEEHSFGSFIKKDDNENTTPRHNNRKGNRRPHVARYKAPDPNTPEETPDPPEPPELPELPESPRSKKTKLKAKGLQSPRSTKSKKKVAKAQTHASALASRSPVGTRIDYAGQISSRQSQESTNLSNEVYQLRALVQLMMVRMEMYERQSDCLVEAGVEHNRQWKIATMKNFEVLQNKRVNLSPTELKLDNIKNLLIERSVQDKWIRKLEEVERGYQNRLTQTQDQLRTLRYDHIIKNKQIIDLKKGGGGSLTDSSRTEFSPSTFNEESEKSPLNNDVIITAPKPVSNNMPMRRWANNSEPKVETSNAGDPKTSNAGILKTDLEKSNNANEWDKSSHSIDPEGQKFTSLLEEMIVSWHTDGTDMSPLSDKGRKKRKDKKKDKKKKKKKGSKGSVASSKASPRASPRASPMVNREVLKF